LLLKTQTIQGTQSLLQGSQSTSSLARRECLTSTSWRKTLLAPKSAKGNKIAKRRHYRAASTLRTLPCYGGIVSSSHTHTHTHTHTTPSHRRYPVSHMTFAGTKLLANPVFFLWRETENMKVCKKETGQSTIVGQPGDNIVLMMSYSWGRGLGLVTISAVSITGAARWQVVTICECSVNSRQVQFGSQTYLCR
jgi:hypothetical protein